MRALSGCFLVLDPGGCFGRLRPPSAASWPTWEWGCEGSLTCLPAVLHTPHTSLPTSRGDPSALWPKLKPDIWAILVLIYALQAHLMVPQKFERKNDSFPTKYCPNIRTQIAVCDLVISACDLTILYQIPEGLQETFLPHTTPIGLTKIPESLVKKIVACLLFVGV